MRNKPHVCMACGQTEQLHYDTDLEVEYYSDDPEKDSLDFWLHEYEFPDGKIMLRACGECSKKPSVAIFEEYQRRVREGEILCFH